jgi:hypothetical protein
MNPPFEAVGARYSMRVYSPPPMVVASKHTCACRVSGVWLTPPPQFAAAYVVFVTVEPAEV